MKDKMGEISYWRINQMATTKSLIYCVMWNFDKISTMLNDSGLNNMSQ